MRRRRSDRLARIEEALAAVVAAANADADETVQRQAEIQRAIIALDGKTGDLAETIRQVMAARAQHDAAVAADAKAARSSAEAAFAGVAALAAMATPAPAGGPGTPGSKRP